MSIRGFVTLECDQKGCHAELVIDTSTNAVDVSNVRGSIVLEMTADGWRLDDNGNLWCPDCAAPADEERDEAYERAAARARLDDFASTGGKDWT